VTPDQARQFSRLVLLQRLKSWLLSGLIAFVALGFVVTISWNAVVSVEETTCRFVRWTQSQNYEYGVGNIVYCDFDDDRTIMASAGRTWSSPPIGTRITLRVEHLVFGTRYKVLGSGL
jgi:hypothetical protein